MDDLPNTTIVRNPENIWWGGGINQGIKLALNDEFEYIFFLNDDIEVPPGWLVHFTGILNEHREVGAIGPLNSSRRDWQGYDNVRHYHPELNLLSLDYIDRQDISAMNKAIRSQQKRWCYVDGMLAFFCAGFRREVVEKAGYLDPDFFPLMCGDDNAYCREIINAGYKLALSLEIYVKHHSGYSVNTTAIETRKDQKATAVHLLKQKYPEYYGRMTPNDL
jgi:GT2 family glycosyltransferase